MRPKIKGILNT